MHTGGGEATPSPQRVQLTLLHQITRASMLLWEDFNSCLKLPWRHIRLYKRQAPCTHLAICDTWRIFLPATTSERSSTQCLWTPLMTTGPCLCSLPNWPPLLTYVWDWPSSQSVCALFCSIYISVSKTIERLFWTSFLPHKPEQKNIEILLYIFFILTKKSELFL